MFTLVLGGGGSAGIGWETGVLYGLERAGVDVRGAADVIGTSAGSIVGVRLRAEGDLAVLYDAARSAAAPSGSTGANIDFAELEQRWNAAAAGATSAADARRRIAAMAAKAETMSPTERRAEIAALLPIARWPTEPLTIVAVSGSSGKLVALTRSSGVDLLDAVAASCAVPGAWPPVDLAGALHVDGAVRSPTNADLATNTHRVLVIAPMLPQTGIERELARLGESTRCEIIAADDAAMTAFGPNPLSPSTSSAAATEGLRQGAAAAERVHLLLA